LLGTASLDGYVTYPGLAAGTSGSFRASS
jgi:hypothetical protein